ncbi:excalibur calcium-binding domain-containing protein [Lysobacter sp. K5869]|uniref:excalibur calcium-binding domain-containing protein n=1 Tax=Lysobacter sp. K5869 TaxID=2820808 RepID=UPI001C063B4A|nr:excalibur calcium-binding domain-containing protein [Lysobacter sp. K5869]QWP76694.1 excalibur calcium-binding domain-containing protein [Lysobacter sp. K5869]
MDKRTSGTLVRWNDERGFGFLAPDGGGPQVFMHVSALLADSPRPQLNERFSFDLETDGRGGHRAARVRRPNEAARVRAKPSRRAPADRRSKPAWPAALMLLAALGGAGWYAHGRWNERPSAPLPAAAAAKPIVSPHTCDDRTQCHQMSSCEEARYFLAHCPNVEMDGDGDGVPCEQQWCH